MPKDVRPRISIEVYQLVKAGAASSCVSENHWLIEAIIEKAAREGFEIIDAQVVHTRSNPPITFKGELDIEVKGSLDSAFPMKDS
jgi:hypothetical protein